VGYRVRSARGTVFRQWATARLGELLVKGFTLDDERLKEGRALGANYFNELLERIRDIRASERMFYQKITDIDATSIDYDPLHPISQTFSTTSVAAWWRCISISPRTRPIAGSQSIWPSGSGGWTPFSSSTSAMC